MGALCFLDPHDPSRSECIDIPVHWLTRGGKARGEVDIIDLIRLLSLRPVTHAFVEQVSAMPGQGVSSMFAFGKAYGIILGVIATRSIPVTLVQAAKWKRALNIPKAKDG